MRRNLTIVLLLLVKVAFSQCIDIKYIRISYHFMLKSDGTGNFNEIDNGTPSANTAHNGYKMAQMFIERANLRLANNAKMKYPLNNQTAVLSIPIRFVLSGVYFHRDDNGYICGLGSNLQPQYGVNINTEINFYVQAGGNYGGYTSINDFSGGIYSSHYWENYIRDGESINLEVGVESHELGHALGLQHPFERVETCDDTPNDRSEVWDSGPDAGNNVMDYNSSMNAWTPCQLNIVNTNLEATPERFVCSADPPVTALYSIPESIYCTGENIILKGAWRNSNNKRENSYRITIYQTSSLKSSDIVEGFWQSSWYQGQYGDINLSNLYTFKDGFYEVTLEVKNETSAHSVSSQLKIYNQLSPSTHIDNISYSGINNSLGHASVTMTNLTAESGSRTTHEVLNYISFDTITTIEAGAVFSATLTDYKCDDPFPRSLFREEVATSQQSRVESYIYCNNNGTSGQMREENEVNSKFPSEYVLLTLMPIPAGNSLQINSNTSLVKVELFDAVGYKSLSQNLDNKLNLEIDICRLSNGFYLAKIEMATGEVKVRRILISR